MAASFFTEDDLLGAASGAADSDERGREKEEGREGGCALSWYRGWLRVRAESHPVVARYTLSYRT